jgi:putative ABC transport system permease protein
MLKHFLKLAYRNLLKYRTYTLMNILGLALGITGCIVIYVIYRFETSFDNYHRNYSRIYRLNYTQKNDNNLEYHSFTFYPLGDAIRREVPNVDEVSTVHFQNKYLLKIRDEVFEDRNAFFVDSSYFKVFDVAWLQGDARTLQDPNSVVITADFADKYFKDESPLGKLIRFDNKFDLLIAGVVQNPPYNTDHRYRIFLPLSLIPSQIRGSWLDHDAHGINYIVATDNDDLQVTYRYLDSLKIKYLGAELARNMQFHLLPLKDNHTDNGEFEPISYDLPRPVLIFLSAIAYLIAFISCINYINMAVAQSVRRGREIGVRKTFGSGQNVIRLQFLLESMFIVVLATVISLAAAKTLLMQINSKFNNESLQLNILTSFDFLIFLILFIVGITFIAGLYPSIVLAKMSPVKTLRSGSSHVGKSRIGFRKILVGVQFFGAQVLIMVTIIVLDQMNDQVKKPIGFNPENVVLFNIPNASDKRGDFLRNQLETTSGVESLSYFSGSPWISGEQISVQGEHDVIFQARLNSVDSHYLDAFKIDLLSGEGFSEPDINTHHVLVNQAAARQLGYLSPIDAVSKIFFIDKIEYSIKGILKDYTNQPFSTSVKPQILVYKPDAFTQAAALVNPVNKTKIMVTIEEKWKGLYHDDVLKVQSMEDLIDDSMGVFNVVFDFLKSFSLVAIIIACVGLYSLVSFICVQRSKEISIRKVFGASGASIVNSVNREFLIIVTFAFIGAAPLSGWIGSLITQEIPDHAPPGLLMYAVVFGAVIGVSLFTSTFKLYHAVGENPVVSIRND